MVQSDDDIMFRNVIDSLKELPRVNAPVRFEADLMRRINSGKFNEEKKASFWDKLLVPSRLIPSAGLAVATIIMLFFVNTSNPVEADNPLSFDPRLREDAVQTSNSDISLDDAVRQRQSRESGVIEKQTASASFASSSFINKSGLNFRQITLTPEEKEQLNQLKERVKQLLRQSQESGR